VVYLADIQHVECVAGSVFRQLCASKVGHRYETTDAQKGPVTSRKHNLHVINWVFNTCGTETVPIMLFVLMLSLTIFADIQICLVSGKEMKEISKWIFMPDSFVVGDYVVLFRLVGWFVSLCAEYLKKHNNTPRQGASF